MNSLQDSTDVNLGSSSTDSDFSQLTNESDLQDYGSFSPWVMIRNATSPIVNLTQESNTNEQINHSDNSSCGCSSNQDTVPSILNNSFAVRAQSNASIIGTRSSDGLYYLLDSTPNEFTLTPGFTDSYFGGVLGLGGADYFIGLSGIDIINGNQNNDTIFGGDGDDLLRGGQDEDLIFGNKGDDIVFGDKGKDTVYAGQDNDFVNGNEGDDVIFGDKGNDILRGGKDNDLINGGDGDDILIGDFGIDTLTGGSGSDVFILRTNTAVSDPLAADIITDFDKAVDLIGIGEDITENSLSLESTSFAPGSSDTLIRVSATGTILGVVKGVSPTDLSGRFIAANAEPKIPENLVTYAAPSIRKLSDEAYEMEFLGSDQSKYLAAIKKTESLIYLESIIYTPSPSGSDIIPKHTIRVNPEGTRMELQIDGSSNIWISERQAQDLVKLKLKTPEGETDLANIQITPNSENQSQDPLNPLCAAGKEFCDKLDKLNVADNLGLLATGLTLTGVGAVGGGVVGAFAGAAKIIDLACLVLYGDDSKLAKKVTGIAIDAFLEKLPVNKSRLLEFTNEATEKFLKTGKAKEILNNLTETAADQFLGKVANEINENKTIDPVSSMLNWLAKVGGVQPGGLMDTFRKTFGIDFCNEQPTPPPPSFRISVTPLDIPCGGTAKLNVKYFNPDNDSRVIEITGTGRVNFRDRFRLPEDKSRQGELNFTLRSNGRGREELDNFLDVSIYGTGGELFADDYRQIQGLNLLSCNPDALLPTGFTITSDDGLIRF